MVLVLLQSGQAGGDVIDLAHQLLPQIHWRTDAGAGHEPRNGYGQVVLDGGSDHVAADIGRRRSRFTRMAQRITRWSGSASAALGVVLAMVVWVGLGWWRRFPRWWEVGATVGLSFVTLLMLVLIQHTQNHDDQAVQLKLDELIRANINATNEMMRLEDASQEDLARIRQAFNNELSG